MPTKFKPKHIQQYHKLHTLSNFMSHQYCPSYTMPNSSTIQKFPKAKITTWSTIQCKISTRANNNQMTMSQHQALNKTWNQQISQQRNPKNKAHLEVHFGVWSMGLRVLEEPFFLIPFKWWYFFPLKVRKDGLLEDAIINAKNIYIYIYIWRFGDGFQKMGL